MESLILIEELLQRSKVPENGISTMVKILKELKTELAILDQGEESPIIFGTTE